MGKTIEDRRTYWDTRFAKGMIFGEKSFPLMDEILSYLEGSPTVTMLGGGYGRNAVVFARAGFIVRNIDISQQAINLGRKLYGSIQNLSFEQADIADLSFLPESLDAVAALYCMNLFPRKELQPILASIHRGLKENGKFCINLLILEEVEYGEGKEIGSHLFLHEDGQMVQFYTERETRELLLESRFICERARRVEEERLVRGRNSVSSSYLLLGRKGS